MKAAFEILRVIQLATFGGLAAVTLVSWRKRRGPAEAWLAGIFSILGGIVAIGFIIPREATGTLADELFRKFLLAVLLLFPYMLFRFADAMRAAPTPVAIVSHALTAIAIVAPFALGPMPGAGTVRSLSWNGYVLLLVAQWVFTSSAAGAMLWRRGRGQPTVVRMRMRFLSLGTLGLAFGIIVSVTFGGAEQISVARVVTQMIGVLCGPLFLLGASPPAAIVMLWRRPEVATMRLAINDLMSAETAEQIAEGLLRPAIRVVGGRAAALVVDGSVVGSIGMTDREGSELRELLERGEEIGDDVLQVPMSVGALYVVSSAYAPYLGREESELLQGTAVLADLALQRVAALERERASAAAQMDFLAVASHDLRTPLAVIQGYTGLMRDNWQGLSDEDKRTFNATIDRQAQHLERLVNDLLLSAQVDAAALHAQPEDVRLGRALRDTVDALGDRTSAIRVHAPEGLFVRVDPEHLQRIVVNLVNNAFAHGAPPVDVTASSDGQMIELRVRDFGAGVPPESTGTLFERFSQPAGGARVGGTGLGLYIVRGLAEEAGGEIYHETPTVGGGACFVVRLPRAHVVDVTAGSRAEVAG